MKNILSELSEKDGEIIDADQVLEYAIDLKNFHKFSEDRIIAPIVLAPRP